MNDLDSTTDSFLAACQNGDYRTVRNITERHGGYVQYCCPITFENGLHKCARNLNQESSVRIAEYILGRVYGTKLINEVSKHNCTPLILAVHFQNEGFVHCIINAYNKVHKNDKHGLLDFSTDGKILIDDSNMYIPNSTALHIAILSEYVDTIAILLSEGASILKENEQGETALELTQKVKNKHEIMAIFCKSKYEYPHYLIINGYMEVKTIALLKIFFENGLDVNSTDSDSISLLHRAIQMGNTRTVQFLISCGADISSLVPHPTVKHNTTSLIHIAAHNKNPDIITSLLEAGANVNARDGAGYTVLHVLALSRGDITKTLECCEVLIEHDFSVHTDNDVALIPLVNILSINSIYMVSAGGDSFYNINSKHSQNQLSYTLRLIPKHIQKLFLEFLLESGFPVHMFIPIIQETNSDLASYLTMRQQTPLCLKRLAANVIRKTTVPNAWIGVNRLSLPPGFNKQYIILNPKKLISLWLKK